MNSIKIPFVTV